MAIHRFSNSILSTGSPLHPSLSVFCHSSRRFLRAKPVTYDVVVYVSPPWYRTWQYKATVVAGVASFVGGVEFYNSCTSAQNIKKDMLMYKVRADNVIKAKPKTMVELKKAWAPLPHSLVGIDKRVEDVKDLIKANHQEIMGAIRASEEKKKKKSWADWFNGR